MPRIMFPDKDMAPRQLNEEISPLNLPEFTGTGRSDEGIFVKVGTLTATQKRSLTTVIEAHVPAPEPPDSRIALIDGMGLTDADKTTLKELLGVR